MKSLSLTPAESLMILSPNSSGSKMIKLTLIDLIFKKAIDINIKDKLQPYNCAVINKNNSYTQELKPHEEILIEILGNDYLELFEFADLFFNQINTLNYKNLYVRQTLVDKGYFKKQRKMLMGLAPYYTYILTDKGLEIKYLINKLLMEAECLKIWLREDLGHAKAYLSVVGSHIFLSEMYDIDDIKKFNDILSYVNPDTKTSDYYDYYLYPVPLEYLNDSKNIYGFNFMDTSFFNYYNSFNELFNDTDISADI